MPVPVTKTYSSVLAGALIYHAGISIVIALGTRPSAAMVKSSVTAGVGLGTTDCSAVLREVVLQPARVIANAITINGAFMIRNLSVCVKNKLSIT
jgi:hypothetical protein